ncbi:hypothetical protein EDC01DRAFT_727310 [Geopyxis carbonaria]|nr:hypothetical protein EDC01DRAFT_727310 [Geopyxis carbonaria]
MKLFCSVLWGLRALASAVAVAGADTVPDTDVNIAGNAATDIEGSDNTKISDEGREQASLNTLLPAISFNNTMLLTIDNTTTPTPYALTPSGQLIVYGDIALIPDGPAPSNSDNRGYSVTAASGRRWPNAIVIYKYETPATKMALQGILATAFSRWRAVAPWLIFRQAAVSAAPAAGVLTITNHALGCFATVGYNERAGDLHLNLGSTCKEAEATHELGHTLGFWHEHQRPDRDTYVAFRCEALARGCNSMHPWQNCCMAGLPAACCGTKGAFAIAGPGHTSGPYDVRSIMHYRANSWARPGMKTLVSVKRGYTVPDKNWQTPSALDRLRLCQLYGRRC